MGNLNGLLNLSPFIAYISQQNNVALWIWSADFTKPLYLSNSCEAIFGVDKKIFSNGLEAFYRIIMPEDKPIVKNEISKRKNPMDINISPSVSHLFFRVKHKNNNLVYIHEFSFSLLDEAKHLIGHCGINTPMELAQWKNRKASLPLSGSEIFPCLENLGNLSYNKDKSLPYLVKTHEKKSFHLTRREAQCLHHLLHGHSNKKIAYILNISSRTVETYFVNLFHLFNVQSRVKLITGISNVEEVLAWEFQAEQKKHNLCRL